MGGFILSLSIACSCVGLFCSVDAVPRRRRMTERTCDETCVRDATSAPKPGWCVGCILTVVVVRSVACVRTSVAVRRTKTPSR